MQDAVRASVVGILSRLESSMPSAVLYPALAALNREGKLPKACMLNGALNGSVKILLSSWLLVY